MEKIEIVGHLDEDGLRDLGEKLAKLFKARRSPDNKERFDLEGGDKTPVGTARTVIRLLGDSFSTPPS